MEFYETDELGGQIDNWCGPTTQCLIAMARAAGFPRVDFKYAADRGAAAWSHTAAGNPSPLHRVRNRRSSALQSTTVMTTTSSSRARMNTCAPLFSTTAICGARTCGFKSVNTASPRSFWSNMRRVTGR